MISQNLKHCVESTKHSISYKSDHTPVILNINILNIKRGPGYFKLNSSLLLDSVYQENIKQSINETSVINKDANPNTLWELIKGTIRNETIKYATKKKKESLIRKETL